MSKNESAVEGPERTGPVHLGFEAGELNSEQERLLAKKAQHGCDASRDRLIMAHLGLVIALARRYRDCGLSMEDLVSEGTLGLVRAVDRFDPGRGSRLSAYAAHWIRLAIRDALSDTASAIRLPGHMVRLLTRWRRAERRLERELGVPPAPDAVAAALGLGPRKVGLVRDAMAAHRMRFGAAVAPGDELIDECPDLGRDAPVDELARSEEVAVLRHWMTCLEAHEGVVLAMRYGLDGHEPRTLAEIGQGMGLSAEWVRRAELRARGRLARWMARPGQTLPTGHRLRAPSRRLS